MHTKQVISEIDFDNSIIKLNSLDLYDDLQYINDELGIRAIGTIFVNGSYNDNLGERDFEEYLELDILAPYEKLRSYNEFKVKIDDYDYSIISGNLKLVINLNIEGIYDSVVEANDFFKRESTENNTIEIESELEEEIDDSSKMNVISNSEILNILYETSNDANNEINSQVDNDLLIDSCFVNDKLECEALINKDECTDKTLLAKNEQGDLFDFSEVDDELDYDEAMEELENDYLSDLNELFFEDVLDDSICATNVVKYIICEENTSYESLSIKYNIDIKKLMNKNNYKILSEGCIVEIPNE